MHSEVYGLAATPGASVLDTSADRPDCAARNIAGSLNLRRLVLVGAALTIVSACAEHRTVRLAAAPDDLFVDSAPVDVNGSHIVSDEHGYVIAGPLEGAAIGVLQGVGMSLAGGARGGQLGMAMGVVIAPFAAVAFGVAGAMDAHPADEVDAAVAAIEQVYSDPTLFDGLAGRLDSEMLELGFQTRRSCVSAHLDGASVLAPTLDCGTAPANRLQLTLDYEFATEDAYQPKLWFRIMAEAVATDADVGRDAEAFRWVYLSRKLDFFAATKDDAKVLRSAIDSAQQELAEKIVSDLFVAPAGVWVKGTYRLAENENSFEPDEIAPGTAIRVPAPSDLVGDSKTVVTN